MNKNQSILPQHVAIIMDGNGRWAKQRLLPRAAGHKAGVDAAKKIIKCCAQKKIPILSLFAFSSENWQRPPQEVSYLMELFLTSLEHEVHKMHENQIQLRFIGDRMRFSDKLSTKISEVEQLTCDNKGMILLVAVDYGGRWDITQAMKQLAEKIELGKLTSKQIDPHLIANHLSFSDLPDPDLFIRTSGELRISNFMLWQLAYSELYFTKTYWPDFNEDEFEKALIHFSKCERRFGRSEAIESKTESHA